MYRLDNLSKSYDQSLVLDSINIEMKPGQFIALMGKNGSGKSTLMRVLAKSELNDSGVITYNNQDMQKANLEINSDLAFVTENHTLPDNDPIHKWVTYYKLVYPHFDDQTFQMLLTKFELNLDGNFSQLSRGQKAKMLFSLNACKKPKVYVLDEITSVLDSGSRLTLMQFLKQEQEKNCLIVMSTNVVSEMQGFASDICFLANTQIHLYSSVNTLHEKFLKFRVASNISEDDLKVLDSAGAKKVKHNADNTWSVIADINQKQLLQQNFVMEDRREIDIEDISNYLTV